MVGLSEWQIGPWTFDAGGSRLKDGEREVSLEHRAARTLELLCSQRGHPVSRDDILAHVWDGRSVSANSVAVVIADLRRALGDDAGEPRFIATVPKRGYRLAELPAGATRGHTPPTAASRARRSLRVTVLVLLLLAAAIFFIARSRAGPDHIAIVVGRIPNDTGHPELQPLAAALQELVTERLAAMRLDVVSAEGVVGQRRPSRTLWLSSRLIVWNGLPTLSMQATDATGHIAWAGMAVGRPEGLPSATIAKLRVFGEIARERETSQLR